MDFCYAELVPDWSAPAELIRLHDRQNNAVELIENSWQNGYERPASKRDAVREKKSSTEKKAPALPFETRAFLWILIGSSAAKLSGILRSIFRLSRLAAGWHGLVSARAEVVWCEATISRAILLSATHLQIAGGSQHNEIAAESTAPLFRNAVFEEGVGAGAKQ